MTKKQQWDYNLNDPTGTYYISIDCIDLEKGGNSPLGEWEEAYVVAGYDSDKYSYDYYWFAKDGGGYGVDLVKEDKLTNKTVQSNIDTLYKRQLPLRSGKCMC